MRFQVVRGYAVIDGALLTKGSSFEAKEDDVRTELAKGIIVPVKKHADKTKPESAE